jgi:hypothetical protein
VTHFPNHFDQTRYEIRAVNIFVSFVEDHELVELPPLIGCLSKHLQENHEKAKRLVFLDELVAEVTMTSLPGRSTLVRSC